MKLPSGLFEARNGGQELEKVLKWELIARTGRPIYFELEAFINPVEIRTAE